MKSPSHSWRNALCMLLVAAALVLRVAVPQGWMLEQDAAGTITVSVCNSDARIVIPVKQGDSHQQDDAGKASSQCVFAGHQADTAPVDGLAPLPLPQLAEAQWDALRMRALSPESVPDLPPARGPPIAV